MYDDIENLWETTNDEYKDDINIIKTWLVGGSSGQTFPINDRFLDRINYDENKYGCYDFGSIEGQWDSIIGWKHDYKIDDPKLEDTAIAIQKGLMDFIKDINEHPDNYFEKPKFHKVVEIPTDDEIQDVVKLILPDDWDECESLTDEQKKLIKKVYNWANN